MLEVNFEAIPQLLLQIYINVNTVACDENDIKTSKWKYIIVTYYCTCTHSLALFGGEGLLAQS
jgi:hypothetical protein